MADARGITGYFWLGIRNLQGKIFFLCEGQIYEN